MELLDFLSHIRHSVHLLAGKAALKVHARNGMEARVEALNLGQADMDETPRRLLAAIQQLLKIGCSCYE